jgi:hypothetical protein
LLSVTKLRFRDAEWLRPAFQIPVPLERALSQGRFSLEIFKLARM